MAKANLRIKEINKILSKSSNTSKAHDNDSDDDDSDLEDMDGLHSELLALQKSNTDNQAKLDYYEKHKKWNVDNMCHVVEERTIVNKVKEEKFSEGGFALPSEEEEVVDAGVESVASGGATTTATAADATTTKDTVVSTKKGDGSVPTGKMSAATIEDGANESKSKASSSSSTTTKSTTNQQPPAKKLHPQPNDPAASATVSALSYHQFTQKYADVVEKFMTLESMDASQEYLLQHGHILLQENASNYLLLASLEDEMNGFHEKMKLVARQSQIISNIAELAKSLKLHPGNVIHPFFLRMRDATLFQGFMEGVNEFIQRIEVRAVQKRKEMDAEREREMKERASSSATEAVDISEIPREERLGPGGLDPLEVIETLPEEMVKAFESRDVEKLKEALMKLDPADAEYHMKRCIDSGLWVSNA